jgi:hydroxymethylbilane synthase
VLAIETREGDDRVIDLVKRAIHDEPTYAKMLAERAFLVRMGGSCQTPLAAHAVDCADGLRVIGMCGMPDGTLILRDEVVGSVHAGAQLGDELANKLLARGAGEILAATKI